MHCFCNYLPNIRQLYIFVLYKWSSFLYRCRCWQLPACGYCKINRKVTFPNACLHILCCLVHCVCGLLHLSNKIFISSLNSAVSPLPLTNIGYPVFSARLRARGEIMILPVSVTLAFSSAATCFTGACGAAAGAGAATSSSTSATPPGMKSE